MINYYKKYAPYLFLLPAAIILIVFFFLPFLDTFLLSFKDYSSNIYNPTWVGLNNYIQLMKSTEFHKVILNTFIFLFCAVPLLVIIPL